MNMITFKGFINIILNLIYPHKCTFCDEVININEEKWICKYCESELEYIVNDCEPNLSVLKYSDNVKNAVYRFKYYNCKEYSKGFSKLMYNKFKNYTTIKYDIIVNVPMFYKKKKKRGYDQAELLAKELSNITKIPVELNNLIRIKNTLPQSKINFKDREVNVENAFKILEPSVFKDKNIVLIDDIYTSGNTINQCCKELKTAGAKNICSLTLFKVIFND